jgi:hypothetical protein
MAEKGGGCNQKLARIFTASLPRFPMRRGRLSKRKRRAPLSATSPDGARSTSTHRAVSAFPPSAPATSRRSRRRARASSRGSARSRRWSSCGSRSSSTVSRLTTWSEVRTTPIGNRRRTPRKRSPMPKTAPLRGLSRGGHQRHPAEHQQSDHDAPG